METIEDNKTETTTYPVRFVLENNWTEAGPMSDVWIHYVTGDGVIEEHITDLGVNKEITLGTWNKVKGWDTLTVTFKDSAGVLWGTNNNLDIYTNNKDGTVEIDIHTTSPGTGKGDVIVTSQKGNITKLPIAHR